MFKDLGQMLIAKKLMERVFILLFVPTCIAVSTDKAVKIAVIFPSDESNINSVGNSLGCMMQSVLDEAIQDGLPISYKTFNDRRDYRHAIEVSNKIVVEKFDIAIGATLSSQALIISKILNENGIFFFAPLATHPDVVQGKKYSVRLPFSDEKQGRVLGEYAARLVKENKARILVLENLSQPYSTFLSTSFRKRVSVLKKQSLIESYSFLDGGFNEKDLFEKLKTYQPHLIFAPVYSAEAAQAYNNAVLALTDKSIFLAADAVGANDRLLAAVNVFKDSIPFLFVQHNPRFYVGKNVSKFRELYSKKCSIYPDTMNVAAGYDVASATVDVIRSKRFAIERFLEILRRNQFDGVLGKLKFDVNGEPEKPLHIYSIQGREVKYMQVVQ